MSLLLKNGTVLDYVSNLEETMDILIENGRIVEIGSSDEICERYSEYSKNNGSENKK